MGSVWGIMGYLFPPAKLLVLLNVCILGHDQLRSCEGADSQGHCANDAQTFGHTHDDQGVPGVGVGTLA